MKIRSENSCYFKDVRKHYFALRSGGLSKKFQISGNSQYIYLNRDDCDIVRLYTKSDNSGRKDM